MSSDSLKDLYGSLLGFCVKADDVLQRDWMAGSVASKESEDDSLAGAWGARPAQDAVVSIRLLIMSTFDHLRALGTLIATPRVIISLATTARGSLEASAQAYYMADPEIPSRERVRRYMNSRLVSLHETGRMLDSFSDPGDDAIAEAARVKGRIESILQSAQLHGYSPRKGDKFRPPHLDEKHPSTQAMVEDSTSGGTASLGTIYWKSLSSVAHSQVQGLVSHAIPVLDSQASASGLQLTAIGMSARDIAVRNLGAVLSAVSMYTRVCRLYGFGEPGASTEIIRVLETWGRIGGVPYPGPGA